MSGGNSNSDEGRMEAREELVEVARKRKTTKKRTRWSVTPRNILWRK